MRRFVNGVCQISTCTGMEMRECSANSNPEAAVRIECPDEAVIRF
jgi:hypothetical protein